MKLPVAYHQILDEESRLFGLTRGQFLAMLLRRKRGELVFERGGPPPAYEFADDDLQTTKLYIWYVAQETRDQMDEDRLQMGNIGPAAWAIFLINQWLGRPNGLRRPPVVP
jgi:hypothetical protein